MLFGSLARGEERRESDIDLLVVFDEAPREEKTQLMSAIYRTVGGKVPVDVIVTDPGEIARRVTCPAPSCTPHCARAWSSMTERPDPEPAAVDKNASTQPAPI
ncbi:MAG: nucleotidyltransferase domain-containing protein [Egibacteraceae bacterium]